MLLVFEDGAGNLVQFSKNKISSINNFFQECKYHNIVELTAKEYPNFFKVNHYKKTKNRNAENMLEDGDDDDDDDGSDLNNGEIYDYNQSEAKDDIPKNQTNDPKQKEMIPRKGSQQHSSFNPFLSQQTKTEAIKTQENDRSNLMGDNRQNQDISGLNKKTKGKPSLHLTVSQTEPNNKIQKTPNNDPSNKNISMVGDMNETIFNSTNPYRKDNFQEDQSKPLDSKGMDYNPASFMAPNMDPLKRLSSVSESPFQFYPTNNRLRPFNNFGLPFGNEEAFNSMLKNYPFQFPISANVPFMGKPSTNGEMDEKILDTAKMLNYLNQAGSTPLNRQNIFTFPQADYPKMPQSDTMRQAASVNAPEYHNPYMEESHDELPALFKGDPRFDAALPSANLNNRRYGNYDGFFNGFEEDYGDKAKKFKHN